MERKILFILILTPLLIFSQKALGYYIDYDDVPDSFKERYFAEDNINYYPTHVGDFWLYAYYDYVQERNIYVSERIVRDTLVEENIYYARYETHYDADIENFKFFSRWDKATGCVYILDTGDYNNNGVVDEDLLGDSLFSAYGTMYWAYLFLPDADLHIAKDSLWYVVENDTVLSRVINGTAATFIYTDKFGVTEYIPDFSSPIVLVGSIIDSVEYGVVGVEETETQPQGFALYQNYPNPFNPTTTIKYTIPQINNVETLFAESGGHATSLRIYNILGEEVAILVNEKQSPGNYTVQFDASDLPSGVYFYTLRVGDLVASKKMVLLK